MGPEPEIVHPSYKRLEESSAARKATKAFCEMPRIAAVVDRIAGALVDPPIEYRQTSEPVVRRGRGHQSRTP